jgi:hypothetical protein
MKLDPQTGSGGGGELRQIGIQAFLVSEVQPVRGSLVDLKTSPWDRRSGRAAGQFERRGGRPGRHWRSGAFLFKIRAVAAAQVIAWLIRMSWLEIV